MIYIEIFNLILYTLYIIISKNQKKKNINLWDMGTAMGLSKILILFYSRMFSRVENISSEFQIKYCNLQRFAQKNDTF